MNTTFKPGDVCVVLHLEQSPPYTFQLLSDEGWWYDCAHGHERAPKGVFFLLERAIDLLKKQVPDLEIMSLLSIPASYEQIFQIFLADLKKVRTTTLPEAKKTLGIMSIRVARRILGIPGESLPSAKVTNAAAKVRVFKLVMEWLNTNSIPECLRKIRHARNHLLGISEPKKEKDLLYPLSSVHTVMAKDFEPCCIVTGDTYTYGVLLETRLSHGHPNPMLYVPGDGVWNVGRKTPSILIPATDESRIRSTLTDPRCPSVKDEAFGEALLATLQFHKELGRLDITRELPPVDDPEQVLGIKSLRLRDLPIPPVAALVRAHLLQARLLAEKQPLRRELALRKIKIALAAGAAMLRKN